MSIHFKDGIFFKKDNKWSKPDWFAFVDHIICSIVWNFQKLLISIQGRMPQVDLAFAQSDQYDSEPKNLLNFLKKLLFKDLYFTYSIPIIFYTCLQEELIKW